MYNSIVQLCSIVQGGVTLPCAHCVQRVVLTGGEDVESEVYNRTSVQDGGGLLCCFLVHSVHTVQCSAVCTLCAECCVDWWWRSGDLLTNFIIAPLPPSLTPSSKLFPFLRKKTPISPFYSENVKRYK